MSNKYKVGDIIRLGSQQPYHYAMYIGDEEKIHFNNEQDKNIQVSIDHGTERRRSTYGKAMKSSGEKYQHIIDNIEGDNTGQSYVVGGAVAIGAVTGSIVSSAFPGIGTIIGTGVGAAIGAGVGFGTSAICSRIGSG